MEKFKTVEHFESKDYSLFNLFGFNREIDKPHVKKLVDSMKEYGFKGVGQVIKTKFIEGVMKYYVVDGQHRLVAAQQLGISFKFELTILETQLETAKFMARFNTSAKSWGTTNFLDVWSDIKIPEYVKLKQIQKETGFQITPLLEAYLETSNQNEYRDGIMKFPNEKNSDKIISQMIDLNKFLPDKAFCRRTIVKVMRNPKYNHKKMEKAVNDYKKLMGSFPENERELRRILDKMVDANC